MNALVLKNCNVVNWEVIVNDKIFTTKTLITGFENRTDIVSMEH